MKKTNVKAHYRKGKPVVSHEREMSEKQKKAYRAAELQNGSIKDEAIRIVGFEDGKWIGKAKGDENIYATHDPYPRSKATDANPSAEPDWFLKLW
jgi:hypothetical protein